MRHHITLSVVALILGILATMPCWAIIQTDIAISTQPNWISQEAADREANEIVSTTLSFSQEDGVAGFSLRQKRNIV